jgi:hypothetical protein
MGGMKRPMLLRTRGCDLPPLWLALLAFATGIVVAFIAY